MPTKNHHVDNGGSCFWSYINRFLSPDSIVPDPLNPQQFNRYTYTLNNPLKYTDPTGHCSEGYMGDAYADGGCWEIYQQIVNICSVCADLGLHNYDSENLQAYLGDLNSGWRPDEWYIDKWISMLSEAGSLGQDLANYYYEANVQVIGRRGVNFAMRLNYDMTIEINFDRVMQKIQEFGETAHQQIFASLGHELVHHRSGYINAVSIQNEYEAYSAQIQLAENWDNLNTGGRATELTFLYFGNQWNNWNSNGANLNPTSRSDMQYFWDTFLVPNYSYTPIFPWHIELDYYFGNTIFQ